MRRVATLIGLAFVLAACGAVSSPPSASPYAISSESTIPSATPWPHCLADYGGDCLGPLPVGTYTTVQFQPPITYTVPAGGWSNFEDLPGNFLLVPPGFDLAGVDTGGGDAIGIYASVAAANRDCTDSEQPGVAHTAAALAAEFAQRPGLTVTTPAPVSVGGLQGLFFDIHMADGWTQVCPYSGGDPVVPLMRGVAPSDLDHPIGPSPYTMRLYLLDHADAALAIELSDISGGTHLDAYSVIVDQLEFGE
jgi:hypothetical protein